MKFEPQEIKDVILITPDVHGDDRGFFLESYNRKIFRDNGIKDEFVQDNHSKSAKNVLRGLHYQLQPQAQAKLVRVTVGEVFDVVVDIRKSSPTFGKWLGVNLSAKNKQMLYVPEGFAHGFLVLSDDTEFMYKCSNIYSPATERGIVWNDEKLGIAWPVQNPLLSEKDKKLPPLSAAQINFS
ncbi:MAG: dTDP-4-dehydrorhamnose 3,5-epimerase [Candidatus Margulisbacteria bacterium]|nr:dTDP-4-dehydrorhamnose 3,5-epimerase [Candidatus Margulisiibacteriota bacterium]